MSKDEFEERAAIMEYDGGMSRFRAETLAAQLQGKSRWEMVGDVAERIVEKARDQRDALGGKQRTGDMPGMQPAPEKEARDMPEHHRG